MGCHDDYSLARPGDFHVRRDVADYLAHKWLVEMAAGKIRPLRQGDILREIR
jgi:hypothetical protein